MSSPIGRPEVRGFRLPESRPWAQASGMKTGSKRSHLRGLFLLSAGCTLGLALCASAFAGPSDSREFTIARQRTVQQRPAQKKVIYYVQSSCSAIPIPLEWVSGIPTTATPMIIIGDFRGHTAGR